MQAQVGEPETPDRVWPKPHFGGSWVVTSRAISRVTIVLAHIRGLITPLITTHEPPSKNLQLNMQELEGNAADITGTDDFGPSVSTEKVPSVSV